MNHESIIASEQRRIERLKRYQLPHGYKRIGWLLFVLSFVAIFAIAFTSNSETLMEASKYGILIGLLIVSVSKEPIEDEWITKLRMQSYAFAFVVGVIYALLMPFLDFGVDAITGAEGARVEDLEGFVVLWMLLFVQVFVFHLLKRSTNDE